MLITTSVQILKDSWGHELFIRFFQELFGDREIVLTRAVLLQMRFKKGINLDMWFEAQFPELHEEYVARTRASRERYWAKYGDLRQSDPRVSHWHRDYRRQYHKHRAILKPLEETLDKELIDAIVEILGLPE